MEKIVIAIGGNAITQENQKGTFEEQMANINISMEYIADLIEIGYTIVLTHGNGPQVGNILIQNDMAKDVVPASPIDSCIASTQGQIGDIIMRCLSNILKKRNIIKDIVTIVTHVEVDENDSAFKTPTKPIGPFYTKDEADKLMQNNNYIMVEDSGRGYRRVVASPKPKGVIEHNTISKLVEDSIVIAGGGGGIPIYYKDGNIIGIEAVIDKDFTSALIAKQIQSDCFIILTGVERVAINYGKPNQMFLSAMNIQEARAYYAEGQFPEGSMGPKVQAAIHYIENGGKKVIITSIDKLKEALEGKTGTVIHN